MITWEGDEWNEADRMEAEYAISETKSELIGIIRLAPDEAFYRLFGDITLEACRTLPGRYHGYVMPGDAHRIKLRIGKVTDRLVIHELGHLINDNVPEHESPAHLLSVHGIKTPDGKLVTGQGANGYARNAGRYAPRNGYKRDNYPYHQHPRNWVGGNDCVEDWPDMFLSWVDGNLQDDERGQAIREFVEGYLCSRLDNTSRSVGAGGSVYPFGGRETETR